MIKINYLILLIATSHILIANCGILDFLSLEEEENVSVQARERESDCLCQKSGPDGSNCICCLDFNISETLDVLDLGPACVRLTYLSQTDGVGMNLTLGKTFSKKSIVTSAKPSAPVCLSMLGGLAKMCSKFSTLTRSASGGLVGCLTMEPKLFGEVPVKFDFPCFDLNNEEIRMIEPPKKAEDNTDEKDDESSTESVTDSDETIGGFKVEDILTVVSKTADQGIKIITELLGIGDDEKPEATEVPAVVESKTVPEMPVATVVNKTVTEAPKNITKPNV
ncbi:CLUMA_CG005039, isoform A [Clunio marinus]|uniref:CLUMA_CG005039, isoform A n=1 Tax=Clunio marinus TaxID=568069 RepID=A0A1J1HXW5_9DIPT|nr:CLUMA_CG005039, isoform A [Clunio marinus]